MFNYNISLIIISYALIITHVEYINAKTTQIQVKIGSQVAYETKTSKSLTATIISILINLC